MPASLTPSPGLPSAGLRRTPFNVPLPGSHDQALPEFGNNRPSVPMLASMSRMSLAECRPPDVDGKPMASPIEIAVIWAQKAKVGSDRWVDSCWKSQIQLYYLRKRLEPVTALFNVLYLSMAFFEEPTWCTDELSTCEKFKSQGEDTNWDIPIVAHQWTAWVEIGFLSYFTFYYWLRLRSLGAAHKLESWHLNGCVALFLCWIDCLVAVTLNEDGVLPGSFRLSRLIRPFVFLSASREMRTTINQVCKSVSGFCTVLLSLFLCVFMFVWFGMVLFCDSKEGGPEGERFGSWSQGFASLWIAFTTANFPDVMIPGYRENRTSFVFFGVYLVLSVFLLGNVLLASVYDSFKTELSTSVRTYYKQRRVAIDHAFNLLAEDGRVPMNTWLVFLKSYCRPRSPASNLREALNDKMNSRRCLHLFQTLGLDQTRGLTCEEFHLIVGVMCDISFHTLRCPLSKKSRRVGGWVKWDFLVDCMIALDLLLLLLETMTLVARNFDMWVMTPHEPWFWALFAFTCLFSVDLSVDIYVQGLGTFVNSRPFQNRYDIVNIYGLLVASLFLWYFDSNSALMKVVVLLHLCRLERLLLHMKPMQRLGTLLTRLAPTYRQLGLLLLIVFYVFTTFGIQIFGGKIYRGNPALDNSAFQAANYYALNFNDFGSGLVTLFCLLVVNNWHVIADGFIRVTSNWAAIFFVSFFIITNLVSLNILMALILDCSATLKDDAESLNELNNSEATTLSDRDAVQIQNFSRRMVLHRILTEGAGDEDSPAPVGSMAYNQLLDNVAGPLVANGATVWLEQYSFFRSQLSVDETAQERLSIPGRGSNLGGSGGVMRLSDASRSPVMSSA